MKKLNFLFLLTILAGSNIFAQNKVSNNDTTKVVTTEQKSDRNVMLNASNNTGPRNVNIGLPAGAGGTTIMENGMPVVYFFWPEIPTKAWRMDAMTNGVKVLDLGQTAIHIGDIGISIGTYDNLGTDKLSGNVSINSNHFGLIRGSANVSAPIKNGWKYSLGGYWSLDPGTYSAKGYPTFFADNTKLFKGAITKDYTYTGGKGSISAMYKFMDTKSMNALSQYQPFIYGADGKAKELDNFKLGRNSYYEISGKVTLKDLATGEMVERDLWDDYGTTSHTIDLLGKNSFSNGYNLNYGFRYHTTKTGLNTVYPASVGDNASGQYTYMDTNEAYDGKSVQTILVLGTRRTPINAFMGLVELEKSFGNHKVKVGLDQWYYDVDKYGTETAMFYQSVEANPRKLSRQGVSDTYGNIGGQYNTMMEYHNGSENKTALFITDGWDIANVLTLNLGARFEYQNIRGDYQDVSLKNTTWQGPVTKIKDDWFNKAFMLNAIYKMTGRFGLLGEAVYNEQAGHMENYQGGTNPDIKKSKIPEFGFGIFYNHDYFSLVSKGTYIQRDEYRATTRFTSPNDISKVVPVPVQYDIQTLGWTTDVEAKYKNFKLHFLFTLQSPEYKGYKGSADFGGGEIIPFNFDGKIVSGVSKVLMEIDPSYQWNKVQIWASARYFSKEYANLSNTLSWAARWETFAGLNYQYNRKLRFNLTVVNLFDQRGAKGSISGTDLFDADKAKDAVGTALAGSCLRPFTVEFGVNYRF